jgi:prepilin-type N-terminal cleavage/methylation domain-containing protein
MQALYMKEFNLKRNGKGFTLLEVLAAIAITGIIVAGVFMALSTETKVLARANTQETAKDMAASAMEYCLSQTYNSTYILPASLATNGGLSIDNPVTSPNVKYIRVAEQQIDIVIKSGTTTVFTLTDYRVNY